MKFINKIKSIIPNFPINNRQAQLVFTGELFQTFKDQNTNLVKVLL